MGADELSRLIDAHTAALVLYARQWCDTPEDAVQEAFVKLVLRQPQPAQLVSWLYSVVRNGAISAGRKARRRRRYEGEAAAQAPGWFHATEAAGLDADLAARALQGLPVEQREVIVARLWGGLTFEQIAALAGTSGSSAHRCYLAGLESLISGMS